MITKVRSQKFGFIHSDSDGCGLRHPAEQSVNRSWFCKPEQQLTVSAQVCVCFLFAGGFYTLDIVQPHDDFSPEAVIHAQPVPGEHSRTMATRGHFANYPQERVGADASKDPCHP